MLCIGDSKLTINDFYEILYRDTKISLSEKALERVAVSYEFLKKFSNDKIIYGINTGLGPMAQYHISAEDQISLQYNAIRSHSSGLGAHIPEICVRASMICSLNAYLLGHSGIHPEVVVLLKEMINRSIIPFVPEHGGVGASGDLVQLAHIALALIGEGEVIYRGEIVPSKTVLEENDLRPVSVHLREGLSLINGTYMMTGIGITNLIHALRLLNWSVAASSMINEIVGSFNDYFSAELNNIKQHPGQQKIAAAIREFLHDSQLIRRREEYFFNNNHTENYIQDKVQEYYSVRCVPQILGPVSETIGFAMQVLLNEANSSSDNPVIDLEGMGVFHGGNFHGDYVSSEMDKLKLSVTKLSMLAERQLNFLLNSKLNGKLPPFVNLGQLGVNFGMQGAQFTATSTVAENQTLSYPMSVHSISCNNDNQDVVSMGTNAALLTKKVIDNTYQILAIEMMAIVQAFDYLKIVEKTSPRSQKIYADIRKLSPAFVSDSPRSKELTAIKDYLAANEIQI